jgi:hypothetical protein
MSDIAGDITDGLGTRVEYHDRAPLSSERCSSRSVCRNCSSTCCGPGRPDRDNLFAERSSTVLYVTGQPPRAWVLEHITRFAPAARDNIRALLLTDHAGNKHVAGDEPAHHALMCVLGELLSARIPPPNLAPSRLSPNGSRAARPARRSGAPSPGMTSSSSATATSARAGSDTSDAVLEWVECPDLDRLLVGTVRQTFRPHEGDRFIAHDRGLLGAWTLDERARLSGRSFRSVASCVLARSCACVRRSGAASPGMRRGGPVAASRRRSGGRRGPATRRH